MSYATDCMAATHCDNWTTRTKRWKLRTCSEMW